MLRIIHKHFLHRATFIEHLKYYFGRFSGVMIYFWPHYALCFMAFSPESRWKNRSSKLLSSCYCTARTQPKNNHYFAARPSLDEFQFHFVVAGTISNELLLWYLSIKCQRPIGRHYTLDWAKCWICHTTGTPPLTRFFGSRKNRVKGKPHYRRCILVLKPQNGEYWSLKSTFLLIF